MLHLSPLRGNPPIGSMFVLKKKLNANIYLKPRKNIVTFNWNVVKIELE